MINTITPPFAGIPRCSDAALELNQATFTYARQPASTNGHLYERFCLSVQPGSVLVIMGASGSGKSTLGKLMAGLLDPQEGRLFRSPEFTREADVVYVDQHPMNTVFPWQKVRRNVEYPLVRLGWSRGDIPSRIDKMLAMFHLSHLAHARPATLSGGELQRLALARTFGWRPKLAILDESLSALDSKTKQSVIQAIRELAAAEGMTIVFITHNISDAIALGTRFVVVAGRPVEIVSDFQTSTRFPRDEADPDCAALHGQLVEVIRHGLL